MGDFQRVVLFQNSDVVVGYGSIGDLLCFDDAEMSKDRPTTGTDGLALPILPPERDARVWARLVQLANSTLLHAAAPAAVNVTLGASELLPVNWAINTAIPGSIIASYAANRQGAFSVEKALVGLLVLGMAATVSYGVLKLPQMQADYALRCPPKESK